MESEGPLRVLVGWNFCHGLGWFIMFLSLSMLTNMYSLVCSPPNPSLLGLNIGGGAEIKLRLRRQNNEWDFFPYNQILDTMLHELCHNEHGPHNSDFYNLWDEIRKVWCCTVISWDSYFVDVNNACFLLLGVYVFLNQLFSFSSNVAKKSGITLECDRTWADSFYLFFLIMYAYLIKFHPSLGVRRAHGQRHNWNWARIWSPWEKIGWVFSSTSFVFPTPSSSGSCWKEGPTWSSVTTWPQTPWWR